MSDYTELVKALRICSSELNCGDCPLLYRDSCSSDQMMRDAAAAIEDLQAEVKRLELDNEDYEYEHRRLKGEIEALQAELEKKRTADCWGCKCEKVEPKRGEVVRCGECKWLFNDSNTFFKPCEVIIPEKDWYCAYGERREG